MTSFELISFVAKNVAICLFPKDRARAEKEARVSLASSCAHGVIKTRRVHDVKNWARNVSEVSSCENGQGRFPDLNSESQ